MVCVWCFPYKKWFIQLEGKIWMQNVVPCSAFSHWLDDPIEIRKIWCHKHDVIIFFLGTALAGPRIIMAVSSKLQFNHNPLLLSNGELTCQTESAHPDSVILKSRPFLEVQKVNRASKVELSHMFTDSLVFLRWVKTRQSGKNKTNPSPIQMPNTSARIIELRVKPG